MEVLHQGFDKLYVAVRGQMTDEILDQLEQVKAHAVQINDVMATWVDGLNLVVHPMGRKGGYQFVCETDYGRGPMLALKAPNKRDPWGVHASFSSIYLAANGLEAARAKLDTILDQLNIVRLDQDVAISRLDYAIDVLAPTFILDPDHFVMHARTHRRTHDALHSMATSGRSGRTTSVTIGKNPNRQVIVYDKREEVMSKRKVEWPVLWNAKRQANGKAALDFQDPATSRVWRVELRAYKNYLRKPHGISGWAQLEAGLPSVMQELAQDIRHCEPTADSNRSRWPLSPLWQIAIEHIEAGLLAIPMPDLEDILIEVCRTERIRQLTAQRHGLSVAIAALHGLRAEQFEPFLSRLVGEETRLAENHRQPLQDRISQAGVRMGSTPGYR
ncbi:hypothetical protein PARPLA_00893 [Rhodobacteraceae bacterium THAF1]|uniref:hypothetical protein n=1 Tax=Palleronia sp. THAF1 TaxID=2587842 RepID=UPI000F3F4D10|nr:hypothetical protein [Palleronia sp. THAF1]QFU07163.1 hypothetical protein FIU81_00560 [Palleronia sp. THAF1]VDC20009.1 hypothetical protein PARPLA_00893 [Rhodobacteraceae bacterium THAF1]